MGCVTANQRLKNIIQKAHCWFSETVFFDIFLRKFQNLFKRIFLVSCLLESFAFEKILIFNCCLIVVQNRAHERQQQEAHVTKKTGRQQKDRWTTVGGAGRRSAGVRADGRAGVAFSPFLRVVFCKSFFLSRCSALRVSPAETRLTVYRRLSILVQYQSVCSWASDFSYFLQFFVLICRSMCIRFQILQQ